MSVVPDCARSNVMRTAGADHVGIGGDFDGSLIWPIGLEDVSGYPLLFAELLARGWTDDDLARLAGGNALRVLGAAEDRAREIAATRAPSLARIADLDGLTPDGHA